MLQVYFLIFKYKIIVGIDSLMALSVCMHVFRNKMYIFKETLSVS